MPGNSIGAIFRLTAFGESHGPAIGGVIDGCPAGLPIDALRVQQELDRRRPGSTALGTSRQEADRVEWLSGMLDGRTLGTPIAFLIRNNDARSADYDALKEVYRPGHADRVYDLKHGLRDHRGGGRSSARVTASAVVGGAIARQMLSKLGVEVAAFVSQVGEVRISRWPEDLGRVWFDPVRCPEESTSARMAAAIEEARSHGDSLGGAVACVVRGLPVGLGEPIYDKLDADLAKAMLSINASKAFAIGEGFAAAGMRGSQHNMLSQGGVTGGISDGDELRFEVAFKPPSTIAMPQLAATRSGDIVKLEAQGRHDPCVVPRAVAIVEAMACLVLADHWLRLRSARL